MYITIIHIKILELNEQLMHIAALPKNKQINYISKAFSVCFSSQWRQSDNNRKSNFKLKRYEIKEKPHHILSTVVGLYVYAN